MAGQVWGPCGRPPSAWALPCSLAVMPTHCRALCTQAWVTALGRQAFNSIQLMASEHPGGLECCVGSGWADWLCCLEPWKWGAPPVATFILPLTQRDLLRSTRKTLWSPGNCLSSPRGAD